MSDAPAFIKRIVDKQKAHKEIDNAEEGTNIILLIYKNVDEHHSTSVFAEVGEATVERAYWILHSAASWLMNVGDDEDGQA
jgi:cyanophycinase-like exopeptidase